MSRKLAEMTWTEMADLPRERVVAILPVGAVEAHGPHLPLLTDGIIAEAMAEAAVGHLEAADLEPLLLPALHYSTAPFAAGFPGTFTLRPAVVTDLICDIAADLANHDFPILALANAHFDPAHLGALYTARERIAAAGAPRLVFPDVTRRALASRLGEEFRSGACHAGRYEGSIVMACRPELVREQVRRLLAPHPVSLVTAIREGKASFEEAGGTQAYFGDPAAATAREGAAIVATLGEILAEAVVAAISPAAQ